MTTIQSKFRLSGLIFFITLCLAIGWLGGMATMSSKETWYVYLKKPALNPPDWVFAPVWTFLYILIGIAGYKIWLLENKSLKRIFVLQLFLNAIWSFLFFGLKNPALSLIDIIFLWGTLVVLVLKLSKVNRLSSYLLLPYLLWVSFATYLNASIWWLN